MISLAEAGVQIGDTLVVLCHRDNAVRFAMANMKPGVYNLPAPASRRLCDSVKKRSWLESARPWGEDDSDEDMQHGSTGSQKRFKLAPQSCPIESLT